MLDGRDMAENKMTPFLLCVRLAEETKCMMESDSELSVSSGLKPVT